MRLAAASALVGAFAAALLAGRPYGGSVAWILLPATVCFLAAGLIARSWAAIALAPLWVLGIGIATDDLGLLEEQALGVLAALALGAVVGGGVLAAKWSAPKATVRGTFPGLGRTGTRRLQVGGAAAVLIVGAGALLVVLEERGATNLIKTSHVEAAPISGLLTIPTSEDHVLVVSAGDPGYCVGNQRKPVTEGVDVELGPEVVEVDVSIRKFEEPHDDCAGIGYSVPTLVYIGEPLGKRAVIDVTGGGRRIIWPTEQQIDCWLSRSAADVLGGLGVKAVSRRTSRDDLDLEAAFALRRLERAAGGACG